MPRCRRSSLAEASDGNDNPARGRGFHSETCAGRPSRSCRCAIAHQLAVKQTVICVVNDQLAWAPARSGRVGDSPRLVERRADNSLTLVLEP